AKFINLCIENKANFFDHADIYQKGECEELFSKAYGMTASKREKIFLQSKCGIRPGRYDFSKQYILDSVDAILKRLNTDYLDSLLLHRPDALVEPLEVMEAFDSLYNSGKVRYFGVSNHKPMQIELLKKYVKQPLIINQMQLSITNSTMISNGINVNMQVDSATDRDGSVLDYCRLNDITIQPWSPFQYGFFSGVFLDNPDFPALNKKITEIAKKYDVSSVTIVMSWLLRHPANLQPVCGTTSETRLLDIFKACDIVLTREEWYEIYTAAGNVLP
ncbi:MAG: aldo/keto reductase, partial [Oscillospiraceae bacterium]